MRLLLISPRSPESFWSFRWALDVALPGKRAINPPLGLATLAALCPESWEVTIVDENIESIPIAPRVDMIGIGGMGVQFERQKELLTFYRSRGYFVVAGGSYASLCPEKYELLADTVIAGEAESIWPRFCGDFDAGKPLPLYRETGVVSLLDSPTPRFDLLKIDRYAMVALQFSRGCPFQCDFCDIIVMFGRKPRTKSVAQIGREIDLLRRLGARNLFFVDDNFIGNRPRARELLKFLGDYQRRHGRPCRFGTEASINLAQDPELLELLREANFQWVFIGIESPDEGALREAGKLQNMREDMLVAVRRIYASGLDVFGGFIVGFDHDTIDTFDRQYDFIMRSGIQVAMVGLLTALPRTPLHARLESEGRLLPDCNDSNNTDLGTNFVPKRMSGEAMVAAYRRLYQRLCSDEAIAARIRAKMRYLLPVAEAATGYAPADRLRIICRVTFAVLRSGGVSRLARVARTVVAAGPRRFSLVVSEWIAGLSMQNFVDRHFAEAARSETSAALAHVRSLRKRLSAYVRDGSLGLSFQEMRNALPHVSLELSGPFDRPFFPRAARHVKRLLKGSRSRVTFVIHQIEPDHEVQVRRLLKRLGRYADRISVSVGDGLRATLDLDSSRFHVVSGSSGETVDGLHRLRPAEGTIG